MQNISTNSYLLQKIDKTIRFNKGNRQILEKAKNDLLSLKKNMKGFNLYAFYFGIAITHTGVIYSQKVVLSELELKAPSHIGICIGVGVISGLFYGVVYGKA